MLERDPLADLAGTLESGGPVDWNALLASEGDARRRAEVRALQDVQRIAEFHHGLQRVASEALPRPWGELLILERVGGGTHGEVYRAWDPALQRDVALKLLREDLPGPPGDEALLAEGRAAARVRHPHAVGVHGIAKHDGRLGLWMELVPGPSLEQWVLREGPLPPGEAVRLGIEIGSALAAVHDAGLVHRDIKPGNVVRDPRGRFVLTDFALGVRPTDLAPGAAPSGTPMYMAPECLAGAAADERSELYSLGALVWFALAGRHPFAARTVAELREQARSGPAPLASFRADLPAPLVDLVARAMASDRAARPPRVRDWTVALAGAGAAGEPPAPAAPRRTRAGPGWWVGAAVVIAAVAGILAMRRPAPREERAPATAPPAAAPTYDVEAGMERRTERAVERLTAGDRVRPGDRLTLRIHTSRPAWVYVINEDERGRNYLLFPQPRFDQPNPIPGGRAVVLPGRIDGVEQGWIVSSRGGREHFLVIASLDPVAELESELDRLPSARPDRPIEYASVSPQAVHRLRGTGALGPVPAAPGQDSAARGFDRFRALTDRETGVSGLWARRIVLENP